MKNNRTIKKLNILKLLINILNYHRKETKHPSERTKVPESVGLLITWSEGKTGGRSGSVCTFPIFNFKESKNLGLDPRLTTVSYDVYHKAHNHSVTGITRKSRPLGARAQNVYPYLKSSQASKGRMAKNHMCRQRTTQTSLLNVDGNASDPCLKVDLDSPCGFNVDGLRSTMRTVRIATFRTE